METTGLTSARVPTTVGGSSVGKEVTQASPSESRTLCTTGRGRCRHPSLLLIVYGLKRVTRTCDPLRESGGSLTPLSTVLRKVVGRKGPQMIYVHVTGGDSGSV